MQPKVIKYSPQVIDNLSSPFYGFIHTKKYLCIVVLKDKSIEI